MALFNNNKAFTLAEILITLGIIGVVAAITIPMLMTKYHRIIVENRLKDSYAIMSNAVKMAEEEFSEMLNISQQTLSRIERGINFLTAETLEKIPPILEINPYELLMNEEDYSTINIVEDIEKHLEYIKKDPKKLKFIQKIIRDTALL